MKPLVSIFLLLWFQAPLALAQWNGPRFGIFTYSENGDGSVTIVRCAQLATGSVVVPAEIEGSPVTRIGESAFNRCERISRIQLPASVTVVESRAFQWCSRVQSIDLPSSLRYIGASAFSNCIRLSSIQLPAGLTTIEEEDAYAKHLFSGCQALTQISVEPGGTHYASVDGVLFDATETRLLSYPLGRHGPYQVPASATSIASSAFLRCHNLTEIIFPDSLAEIGDWAFSDCSSLTAVTFPDSMAKIGKRAFESCTSLREINPPHGASIDYVHTFIDCPSLTVVTIPSGKLTSTFSGCTALTDVGLGEGVTTLDGSTFWRCTALSEIHIPSGVTRIDGKAFQMCRNMQRISVDPGNEHFVSIEGVLFDASVTTLIYYPTGRQGPYRIPDQVQFIGDYAFAHCEGLTDVIYPGNLTPSEDSLSFSAGAFAK